MKRIEFPDVVGTTEELSLVEAILSGRFDGTFLGSALDVSDIWRAAATGEFDREEVQRLCMAFVSMSETAEMARRSIKDVLGVLNAGPRK